jgi:hypothetical protein
MGWGDGLVDGVDEFSQQCGALVVVQELGRNDGFGVPEGGDGVA